MHPRLVIALAGLGALDLGYIACVLGPDVLVAKTAGRSQRGGARASAAEGFDPAANAEFIPLALRAAPAPAAGAAPLAPAGEQRRGPPGETWWIVNFPAAGQVTLSEAAEQQLSQIAARFARSHDVRVNIVGHADERGLDTDNAQLGALRAQAVARALERAGFDPKQVSVGSRGEAAPAVLGSDPDAWAANRRAEIEIITLARSETTGESTP